MPETLTSALDELDRGVSKRCREDAGFKAELGRASHRLLGPPDAALPCRAARCEAVGHQAVYLKREDLNHTGAHKINNTLGQGLLAKRMGKKRIIAETGAGQHGVATATACALDSISSASCTWARRTSDRQALNVYRMELLGAEVSTGRVRDAHAKGRHQRGDPGLGHQRRDDPLHHRLGRRARTRSRSMVRDFQSIIGREARAAALSTSAGRLPAASWWLASVEAPTRSASSTNSCPMRRSSSSASKPVAPASIQVDIPRRWLRAQARCPAWFAQLSSAGRRRPGGTRSLGVSRTRLSGCRAGAFLLEGLETGSVYLRYG